MLTTLTAKEAAFQDGRRFFWLHNVAALAASGTIDLVGLMNGREGILETIPVVSDSESLSWQPFVGPTYTAGSGTLLTPVARNSAAVVKVAMSVEADPTVSADGTPLNAATPIVALQGPGSRNFIDQDLLDQDFLFSKNTAYMVRVTNTSASAAQVNLSVSFRNVRGDGLHI